MEKRRQRLLKQLWAEQDKAYALMEEYDSLPHHYGNYILFQAEGDIISLIAAYPGITVTDLSNILKKTTSACSQSVRKLCDKGLVEQRRNSANKRLYNLFLTAEGEELSKAHQKFNRTRQKITFDLLSDFTEEELEHHIAVQKKLNEAYQGDIQRSRENFFVYRKEED